MGRGLTTGAAVLAVAAGLCALSPSSPLNIGAAAQAPQGGVGAVDSAGAADAAAG